MLKRTLCAAFAVAVLVAFSVPAFAGSHHKMRVRGTVESVDPAQKTFVVKDRDGKAIPFISDFFDFSIYIDADETDLERWYVERFMRLRQTAFRDPKSYFRRYAEVSEEQALHIARGLWARINLVNLKENIQPTRPRADLVLRKNGNHAIETVMLRKL